MRKLGTCIVLAQTIDEEASPDDEMPYKDLGDILVERGDLTPEEMQKALTVKKRLGEVLIENGIVPNSKIESALAEQRHVRDLSSELGKELWLTTYGAETELDKTVIERMGDPLVHIIRNCIDHGIEDTGAFPRFYLFREHDVSPGKGERKLASPAVTRFEPDGPAVFGDDPVGNGEAQPCSFAHGFCREKGIKDLRSDRL